MKTSRKVILAIVSLLIVITVYVSFSYAYYSANPKAYHQTETQIRSKKIGLVFNDTKEVDVDMHPGKSETKTFNVENNSDDAVTYNIKISNITNTFKDDVVYSLYYGENKVAGPARLPKTSDTHYIYTGITINPGEKFEYTLKLEYENTEDTQIMDGQEFTGTVEIDAEEVDDTFIYTPEDTITISSSKTRNNFEYKNISSTIDTTYNIKVPTTNGEDINYVLTKNGEIVSSGLVPKDGELPYLLLDQNLVSGQADRYRLILSNIPAGSNYSGVIETDSYDVDTTGPNASIVKTGATSKTVTFKGECSDDESDIINYYFYMDNNLITTRETNASEVEYTYENVTEGNHTFKLTCENFFNTKTSDSKTESPNTLVMPEVSIEEGWKPSKAASLTYSGEGTYLLKATGEVKSDKDLKSCTVDESTGEFTCNASTSTKDLVSGQWYETDGETNVTLTYTSNGKIIAMTSDGLNYKKTEEKNVTNVDPTSPTSELTVLNQTSATTKVKVNGTDEESGISKYEFYLDGNLVETINTTDTEVEYTYTSLVSGDHTYKVVVTNGSGLTFESTETRYTDPTKTPTYEFDSEWSRSKDVVVDYHESDGTYLFKITGEVTSSLDATDCGTESIDGQYSCTSIAVSAGTTLTEGKWYKVDSNPTLTFRTNGSIIAKTADGTNWKQGSSQSTTKIDPTAPTISLSTGSYTSGSWINGDVTVTITSEDTQSGIDHYEMKRASGDWETISSNEYTFTNDINETISFRTVDKVGNISEEKSVEIKIDKLDPIITFEPNKNTTWAHSQSTTVTVEDDYLVVSSLKYLWSTSSTTPQESSFTTSFTSGDTLTKSDESGRWYLWILAKDETGNTTIVKAGTYNVDNSAPTGCRIGGNSTDWTQSKTLTFRNASDNSEGTIYYKVVKNIGGVETTVYNYSATKPSNLAITENGTYTLYLKDELSNETSCSTEVNKIDTTAPIAGISLKNKTSKTITVTGTCGDSESDIKTYEFYYDGALYQTYTTNASTQDNTYTNVPEGDHTLKLVCTNNANNTSDATIIIPPQVLCTPNYSVASGYAQSKTTTIDYGYASTPGCGGGTYLLKVTGKVKSNIDATECTENSTESYTCNGATVTAGSTLTEGKWYSVTSNPTLTYTSNGSVVAKTADEINSHAGNSLTITGVDRTVPSIPTITNSVNGAWTNGNITVTMSATDTAGTNESASGVAGFQYKYSATSNEWSTTTLAATNGSASDTWSAERNETVYYRAVDAVGNIGPEASTVIKIDKTSPVCSWGSWSNAIRKSGETATITLTCTDAGSRVTMNLATTDFTVSGANLGSITNVTKGGTDASRTYTVTFTAGDSTGTPTVSIAANKVVDVAGNKETNARTTSSITVDNSAPTFSVSVSNGTTYSQSKTATITLTDSGGSGLTAGTYSFKYAWGTSAVACSSMSSTASITVAAGATSGSTTATISSGTGAGTIYVCNSTAITDRAGNSLAASTRKSATMYLDNTAPRIDVVAYNGTTWSKYHSATVAILDDDAGFATGTYKIRYVWATSQPSACNSTNYPQVATISVTQAGAKTATYDFEVVTGTGAGKIYACNDTAIADRAENSLAAGSVKSATMYQDNTAPTFSVTNSTGTTWKKSHTATVTLSDTSGSGFAAGTYSFKYAWGTSAVACTSMSSTASITISTAGATSGSTSITLSSGTGAGQLYVCNSAAISDRAENSLAANTRQNAAMYLDNSAPTLTVNSKTTYAKSQSHTITLADTGSGLAAGTYTIRYGWGTSAITACNTTSTPKTASITVSAGAASGTATATVDTSTGAGKIYICNAAAISDRSSAANTLAASTFANNNSYLDNTPPTNCTMTVDNTSYTQSKNLSIGAATDAHNGVVQYKLTKTVNGTTTTLVDFADNNRPGNGTYNVTENATYTLYCRDKLTNQSSTAPSVTVSKIDRTNPTSCSLTMSHTADTTLRLSASGADGIGVKTIEFYSCTNASTCSSSASYTVTASSNAATKDITITPGTTYYYKARCKDEAGNYKESTVVSGTPNTYRYYSSSTSQKINSTSTGTTSTSTGRTTYYRTDWTYYSSLTTYSSSLSTSKYAQSSITDNMMYGYDYIDTYFSCTDIRTSISGRSFTIVRELNSNSIFNLPYGSTTVKSYTQRVDTYKGTFNTNNAYETTWSTTLSPGFEDGLISNYWKHTYITWNSVNGYTASLTKNTTSYGSYSGSAGMQIVSSTTWSRVTGSSYGYYVSESRTYYSTSTNYISNSSYRLYSTHLCFKRGNITNATGYGGSAITWSLNTSYISAWIYFSSYHTYSSTSNLVSTGGAVLYGGYRALYRTDTTTYYGTFSHKNGSSAGYAYYSTRYALE